MEDAATVLRAAIRSAQRANDDVLAGRIRMSLAAVQTESGRSGQALRTLDRAAADLAQSPSERARLHSQRTLVHFHRGELAAAIDEASKGLHGLRLVGDLLGELRQLVNRSIVLLNAGRIGEAVADLQRAQPLARELDQPLMAAGIEHNLGVGAARLGDLPTALRHFDAASTSYRALGSARVELILETDRAEALLFGGLFAEAERTAARAVALATAAGHEIGRAEALQMVAAAQWGQGKHGAAATATDAYTAFLTGGNGARALVAAALSFEVGLRATRSVDRAEARAQRIALREAGWVWEAARLDLVVAEVLLSAGESGAEEFIPDRKVIAAAPLRLRLLQAHVDALLLVRDGRYDRALDLVDRALAEIETSRADYWDVELRAGASVAGAPLASMGLALAFRSGDVELLRRWAERWRASSLRAPGFAGHSVRERPVHALADPVVVDAVVVDAVLADAVVVDSVVVDAVVVDAVVVDAVVVDAVLVDAGFVDAVLAERLGALRTAQVTLAGLDPRAAEIPAARVALLAAERAVSEWSGARTVVRNDRPELPELPVGPASQATDAGSGAGKVAGLLRPVDLGVLDVPGVAGGAVLIEFLDIEDHLCVIVSVDGTHRVVRGGPVAACIAEAQNVVGAMRRAVVRPITRLLDQVDASALLLDRLLFSPELAASVDGTNVDRTRVGRALVGRPDVVIVVCPALAAVPWGALPTLVNLAFQVVPSRAALDKIVASRRSGGSVLVAAGPDLPSVFDEIDAVASVLDEGGEVGRPIVGGGLRGEVGSGLVGAGPGAGPGVPVHRLAGADATVGGVLAGLSDFDIAHIAAHGFFRSDNPLFSSLRFADGNLMVYDLLRLPSLPHTLVFSACHVGRLASLGGGEIMGTVSALLGAGVQGVVAPLDAVADDACAALMPHFYRSLVAGDSIASSLRDLRSLDDRVLRLNAQLFLAYGGRVGQPTPPVDRSSAPTTGR